MRKIYIRTSDIFEYKDEVKRMKYFDFCHKKSFEMRSYMPVSY